MRRTGRRAGRGAGPEIRPAHRGGVRSSPRSAGGAPGGAAFRWQGFARLQIAARARLGTGLANPSEWASQTHSGKVAQAVRSNARLPPRGLANPWRLSALHSPFGETEKGPGGAHAEVKQPGGAALAACARAHDSLHLSRLFGAPRGPILKSAP